MSEERFQHIHPDYRHVLAYSAEDRIGFMESYRWIGYPAAQKVLDTLQGLMEKPKQTRMPNLLITGEANNGKTTVVERFWELQGQSYINEDNEPVKPVILAQSPPSADEKALYIHLLERFHPPYRDTDPRTKLRHQVIHLFRSCHVRLLILDEIHSLLTGSTRKQQEVMNALKLMCNELAIPIVGVGTPDAVRVLHLDPQHASRFDVMTLPLWELNRDFQRFLASFERILPLKKPSGLSQPELAKLLHAISGGNTGNLRRLLTEAAKEAICSGQEYIDKTNIQSHSWIQPTRGIREMQL